MSWKLIKRGRAGWHAADETGLSSSGGSLEYYLRTASEGALVSDADEADAVAFTLFVYNGPMPDPAWAPDAVRRLSDSTRERAARMIPGMSGGFEALATAAQDPTYTGLDFVGLGVYEGLLRKIPGIKIGHVRDGAVVWSNE